MLDRAAILSKKDLKKEKVNIPEWGGDVYVSEMTGAAKDEWEQQMFQRSKGEDIKNVRAKLVVATVVDEKGNRVFSEKDIEEVGSLSAAALHVICVTAQRINGILADSIETAEKN